MNKDMCDKRRTPVGLDAYSAQDLLETPCPEQEWFVEGLVSTGLYVLAGAPKSGKSWLSLWMGNCIACGLPVWKFRTRRVGVLYLALEDTIERVQRRLWAITDTSSDAFQIVTQAGTLGGGLLEQISHQLELFPDVRVVFVDTLAMVRDDVSDSVYASDYKVMSSIKRFADARHVAIIVVTHTRKADDADPFNTVTGSTAITGAADVTMVLRRESRSSPNATLMVTGRDGPDRELDLELRNCVWVLLREPDQAEMRAREVAPVVHAVLDLMASSEEWSGTASELVALLPEGCREAPNVVSKHLAEGSGYMLEQGVSIQRSRKREGRLMRLSHVRGDGYDGDDDR
jgi:hypothetical protein